MLVRSGVSWVPTMGAYFCFVQLWIVTTMLYSPDPGRDLGESRSSEVHTGFQFACSTYPICSKCNVVNECSPNCFVL